MSAISVFWRLILTAAVILLGGWLSTVISVPQTVITGQAAASQFQPSDAAFFQFSALTAGFRWVQAAGITIGVLLLIAIWWGPVRKMWAALAAMGAVVLMMILPQPAEAYYNKTDYADPFFILPNESAFLIPDVGDNQSTQAAFGSAAYLQQKKIPAKRILVPHAKLPATGGYFEADYFVPSARLIILDRTPVYREWVAASHRGTSQKDESIPCQTKEGLDFKVGISIAAFVTEEDAATFMYWFGVKPPAGDRTKPEVIFTSVYYGKNLNEIMDTVVRGRVQALVCDEVVKKTMKDANAQMGEMMGSIEPKVKGWLASRGVTLDFVGWGDTVNFDHAVQESINRLYVASNEAAIADAMKDKTGVIQAMAQAEATRAISTKWDGKLPSSLNLWWLPEGVSNLFTGMLKSATPPAPATGGAK